VVVDFSGLFKGGDEEGGGGFMLKMA
jgi:hypothetical protein